MSVVSEIVAEAMRVMLFVPGAVGSMHRTDKTGGWDVVVPDGRYELRRLVH